MPVVELELKANVDDAVKAIRAVIDEAHQELGKLQCDVEAEVLHAAFEFGKRVQRLADKQAEESARGSRVIAYMFCGFCGFVLAMVVAGVLTFWKLGLKVW